MFILLLGCFVDTSARRIFGGTDVTAGDFSYVASVGHIRVHKNKTIYLPFCTCSVLSPSWTLTAAHCIQDDFDIPSARINHGYTGNDKGNYTKVLEKFLHPGRDLGISPLEAPHTKSDIALMRTEGIYISQYGVLSAVDHSTMIGLEINIFGYGCTNVSGEVNDAMSFRKPLQSFKAMVSRCKEDDPEVYTGICFVSACGSLSLICGGDSGGPGIHTSGIIGVHSHRATMCDSVYDVKAIHKHTLARCSSGILQSVSSVMDWLSGIIASNAGP